MVALITWLFSPISCMLPHKLTSKIFFLLSEGFSETLFKCRSSDFLTDPYLPLRNTSFLRIWLVDHVTQSVAINKLKLGLFVFEYRISKFSRNSNMFSGANMKKCFILSGFYVDRTSFKTTTKWCSTNSRNKTFLGKIRKLHSLSYAKNSEHFPI